jgi:hypothetical protein
MRQIRFTLAAAMIGLTFFACGFVALRSGSDLAYRAAYTSTLLTLLVAGVVARDRGGFWAGFSLVGWGYFLLSLGPWFGSPVDYGRDGPPSNPSLLTAACLFSVAEESIDQPDPKPNDPAWGRQYAHRKERIANTVAIGQALLTLLLATIGGMLALVFRPDGSAARGTEGPSRRVCARESEVIEISST